MNPWEPLTLEWEGKSYTIPPDGMMKALRLLEYLDPPLTITELSKFYTSRSIPRATMALALATLLRYAGATTIENGKTREVTEDDVVHAMFASKDANLVWQRSMMVMNALFRMMLPGKELQEEGTSGKEDAAEQRAASSPTPISSRSVKAG